MPDKAFTDLLGQLQADGLLLNGLSGELSDAGRQSAQRDAIRDALAHLRAEAADIADTLHKKVGALKQLSVNGASAPLPPGPRVMMMKAAAAAPQLAPDKVTISASVSAQIELTSTGN
ncbi:SIMPL domain-containing protein [Acidocella sp. MX-AZ03]|nr:SIMPL domain-containing protein [Acidocella sp. MX-AZ03]WBO60618.1 SIMPL domain-containing protein [Acidocella sp. MX-AZ03]